MQDAPQQRDDSEDDFGEDLQALAVAALLHDVGKAIQNGPASARRGEIEREDDQFKAQHRRSLTHEEWSADYLRRHVPELPKAQPIALNHHAPSDDLERMLQLADHLSAGEGEPEEGEGEDTREVLLANVLSQVSGITEAAGRLRPSFLPIAPLAVERSCLFPVEYEGADTGSGYDAVVRLLEEGVPEYRAPFRRWFERLQHLSRIALAQVPSVTDRTMSDVSLYDHQRLAAALAVCLCRQREAGVLPDVILRRNPSDLLAVDRGEVGPPPLFLLVGGDLTGIQSFLYRVGSDRALRSLKGRSAYLQILTETVTERLLARLGLLSANVVYRTGGHFFLLAHAAAQEKLVEARREIEEILLGAHGADLGVAIAWEELRLQDFRRTEFGSRWGALFDRLRLAKGNRFAGLSDDAYREVFGPFGEGGHAALCPTCGVEMEESEEECPWCVGFAEIGDDLAHLQGGYVAFRPTKGGGPPWQRALSALGFDIALLSRPEVGWDRILALSHFEPGCEGVFFLGGRAPLTVEGHVAVFEDVARAATGWRRWGVLRGDIDSLGLVFREGLGDNRSLSRMASLSGRLELFFGSWLDRLVEEASQYGYTIYAGGDDFFVVGPWDTLPTLVEAIRESFRAYTGGNPHLTLSAAMALPERTKAPLRAVAHKAGRLLDEVAKVYIRPDGRAKDAFVLFGRPLDWAEGLAKAGGLRAELVGIIEEAPRSLLQILYDAEAEFRRSKSGAGGARVWRFLYSIRRYGKGHAKVERRVRRLEEQILGGEYEDTLGVATLWAELLTRAETGGE